VPQGQAAQLSVDAQFDIVVGVVGVGGEER
jgi:hypothetical protein